MVIQKKKIPFSVFQYSLFPIENNLIIIYSKGRSQLVDNREFIRVLMQPPLLLKNKLEYFGAFKEILPLLSPFVKLSSGVGKVFLNKRYVNAVS